MKFNISNKAPIPINYRTGQAIPMPIARAIDEYRKVYLSLYGVNPIEPRYENGYIYLDNATSGVALAIFKDRIKQLKFRKG